MYREQSGDILTSSFIKLSHWSSRVNFLAPKGSAPEDLQAGLSMPGNEVADKVHNFFEQDNLAPQQSSVGSGNWSTINNNVWLSNQRHNGPTHYSHQKMYGIQSSETGKDSQAVDARNMPFGANLTELSLRSEIAKNQRNPQLSLNGFVHGPQGFQNSLNQVEFLGADLVSNQQNMALRNLAILESQQGQASEHSSDSHGRNSERFEAVEAPVNFDFFGSQQVLMRSQQPGIPQPRMNQQPSYPDMQLLKQQFFYKQLQELERQRQLHELDVDARQQNLRNQMPFMARQGGGDQLPPMVSGAPIQEASGYLWPSEVVPQMMGEHKVPNSSQMVMLGGNMNWVRGVSPAMQGFPNGPMPSHDQSHGLRTMGFIPSQTDQSPYGVSGRILNPYSNFQGVSQDSPNVLNKMGETQVEKSVLQPNTFNTFQGDDCAPYSDQVCIEDSMASKQNFHGKHLFSQGNPLSLDGSNSGINVGHVQQAGSQQKSLQMHDFGVRQEAVHVGPSQGLVALDSTEEKILYSGDDGIWDGEQGTQSLPSSFSRGNSLVAGGFVHGNQSEDYMNVFPSVQNGSWSALMQSAVAEASSSDTGLQDELSGLSFQKNELSVGNTRQLNDGGKQQVNWVDPSASSLTSRPFPLFDDANMSPGGDLSGHAFEQAGPNFRQRQRGNTDGKEHGGHTVVRSDTTPADLLQRSPQEASKWSDSSPQQRPIVQGTWKTQSYEHSEGVTNAKEMGMHGSWLHQQGVPSGTSYKIPNKNSERSDTEWNINESEPPNIEGLQVHPKENSAQLAQSGDANSAVQFGRDHEGTMWRTEDHGNAYRNSAELASLFPSSTSRFEQPQPHTGSPHVHSEDVSMSHRASIPSSSALQEKNRENLLVGETQRGDYNQFSTVDSSVKYRGNENQQSKTSYTDKAPVGIYEKNTEKFGQSEHRNDGYLTGQHTVGEGQPKENAWFNVAESRRINARNQKSGGQAGKKSVGGSNNQPSGVSRKFNYHPMGNVVIDAQQADDTRHGPQGFLQQGFRGSKTQEQASSGPSKFVGSDTEKGFLESRAKGGQEQASFKGPFSGGLAVNAAFDRLTSVSTPKNVPVTSQNMLELLNKVDQSRDDMLKRAGTSDRSHSSEMCETGNSDTPSHTQYNQSSMSASQGFGLRLAPPSQRPQNLKHDMSPQAPSDSDLRCNESEEGDKNQAWLHSTGSGHPEPHSQDVSQREYLGNKPSVSVHLGHEFSSGVQDNNTFAPASSTGLHSSKNLSPYQASFGASGKLVMDRPGNMGFMNSADRMHGQPASGFRENQDSQDGGKFLGRERTSHDSLTARESSSSAQVPTQHLHSSEVVSSSQASATPTMPQPASFSTMLHNVWTDVSSQRSTSGVPQKNSSGFFQSIRPTFGSLESSSHAQQKLDDPNIVRKEEKHASDIQSQSYGPCLVNTQQVASGEEQMSRENLLQQTPMERTGSMGPHHLSSSSNAPSVPEESLSSQACGPEQAAKAMSKHLFNANSVASLGSVRSHSSHQEGQDLFQTENGSFQKSGFPGRGIPVVSHASEPSGFTNQNYSLLHQMQAMKSAESDLREKGSKRMKISESSNDASRLAGKASQHLMHNFGPSGSNLTRIGQHQFHPSSDAKSLVSPLDSPDAQNASDLPSQSTFGSFSNETHNHSSSQFSLTSSMSFVRGNEHSQQNPQRGLPWMDQFGYKNGQILALYEASQNAGKATAHQYLFGRTPQSTHPITSIEQRNAEDANLGGSVSTAIKPLAGNQNLSSLPETNEQALAIVRPKKRKSMVVELMPWHKEITQGSKKLQSISVAELDWARTTRRLIEKVEDEADMNDDVLSTLRPRKRLIFTTQLIKQLFSPLPAAILSEEASSEYESAVYFLSRVALGDACSLITYKRTGSGVVGSTQSNNENATSGSDNSSESGGDQILSKVIEGFSGKAMKLENDLLRLDKAVSMLDIRLELHDLERFSIINRFARFHGRGGQVEVGVDTSAASTSADPRKTSSPHRYVTAHPMPRNLPEGVFCLSL
ncbi:hypothetical protein AMTRI_Chr10g224800 [Amborella trichopoda]